VPATGSRSVTPDRSTDYTIAASGANGASAQATARVTVTQPAPKAAVAPSATDEELFAQNIHDVYFDYDKYDLRAADTSAVEQDAAFLNSHHGMKTLIEGHCDDRGSEEYNLALGESRAETMKKALVTAGIRAGSKTGAII
jgi:peptidoglycan-associated lipoprotein